MQKALAQWATLGVPNNLAAISAILVKERLGNYRDTGKEAFRKKSVTAATEFITTNYPELADHLFTVPT